ncbi:hypothetical protein RN001_007547 [Aquatica leii]|uniref:Uncharacterized protein n=1 Tax=Aquatica leii TaxID=1421715 RepID=A0AAN7PBV2_9COLE|nr:hypothetical protein RN001_007547 [Aquatica leii]
MKIFIILNVLICVVVSEVSFEIVDDWNALATPYSDVCISESGANSETAKKMFENYKLVDEERIRCYFKCILMQHKFMQEDGSFDVDRFVKGNEHVTREIADTCLSKIANEKDLCKKGYLLATCVIGENA